MTQMTLEVPDALAEKIRPLGRWLPTVLELGLSGFKTPAAARAAEVIEFLREDPGPEEVLAFHASGNAQRRLRRLLALNEAGELGTQEQLELEELQRIEHVLVLLKAEVAGARPEKD